MNRYKACNIQTATGLSTRSLRHILCLGMQICKLVYYFFYHKVKKKTLQIKQTWKNMSSNSTRVIYYLLRTKNSHMQQHSHFIFLQFHWMWFLLSLFKGMPEWFANFILNYLHQRTTNIPESERENRLDVSLGQFCIRNILHTNIKCSNGTLSVYKNTLTQSTL